MEPVCGQGIGGVLGLFLHGKRDDGDLGSYTDCCEYNESRCGE